MGRKKKEEADRQPLELGELKKIVTEFMDRFNQTENEITLLKEDQANLIEEYSDRLDMKTMKQAIRTIKIEKKVTHRDTYDMFVEVLKEHESI